jgi:hypothetical protein
MLWVSSKITMRTPRSAYSRSTMIMASAVVMLWRST